MQGDNQNSETDVNGELWIDSICIDQESVQERGHQVQRMGNIYASAMGVLVWLGKRSIPKEIHCWLYSLSQSDSTPSTECPQIIREHWDRLRFDPYWYRAWIVQELLLAKSVKLVLSGETIDWKVFGGAITRTLLSDSARADPELDYTRLFDENIALSLYSFWCDRWNRDPRGMIYRDPYGDKSIQDTFWQLMHMHRHARCTDPRDRIYSLLGLLDGEHDFVVDYGESSADLFWRAGEHFDAWSTPDLVDVLRIALLQSESQDQDQSSKANRGKSNPLLLNDSLRGRQDLQVRIPVRRAWPTTSLSCRLTRRVKCKFDDCCKAPRIQCTRTDILLCTNARTYGLSDHGCIHALAHPVDKPAAERFEIKLIAHHGGKVAITILPPTALQVHDEGTDAWVGVSTWSSLRKALERRDLDRADRVKLLVPAKYAVWIWFGVHPHHLEDAFAEDQMGLPSAQHALPPGTKITRNSIEVPPSHTNEGRTSREGIFE